jgi:hypothetical protein
MHSYAQCQMVIHRLHSKVVAPGLSDAGVWDDDNLH